MLKFIWKWLKKMKMKQKMINVFDSLTIVVTLKRLVGKYGYENVKKIFDEMW